MELEVKVKLTNGADSETAPLITFSNFNYTKDVDNSVLYEQIVAGVLDAIKEPSS